MKRSMKTDYRVMAEIDSVGLGSDHLEIRTNGGPGANKFGFGFTGKNDYGRDECGGPIFSGPYLYGYGLAMIIHNGPVVADVPIIYLESDDVIRVKEFVKRGQVRYYDFRATVKRGYPDFECIGAHELTAGGYREIEYKRSEITKEEFSEYLLNRRAA